MFTGAVAAKCEHRARPTAAQPTYFFGVAHSGHRWAIVCFTVSFSWCWLHPSSHHPTPLTLILHSPNFADLQNMGLPPDTMKTAAWTEKDADKVAAAILEWAKDNGACAWDPLTVDLSQAPNLSARACPRDESAKPRTGLTKCGVPSAPSCAACYSHWFQPMGSSGFRHGQAGGLTQTMIEFDRDGNPFWRVRPPKISFGTL